MSRINLICAFVILFFIAIAFTSIPKNIVKAEAQSQSLNSNDIVWFDDSVPTGAVLGGTNESWGWIVANPSPLNGSLSHQSTVLAGIHQHYFYSSPQTFTVNAGDILISYVYIDPANKPTEIMLQWGDLTTGWEHRAYWAASPTDLIPWGVNGTVSRFYMGQMPAAGQWVRLEVPASVVGLEGKTLNAMAFTLYGGRAAWDYSGKFSAQASGPLTLNIAPSDNSDDKFRVPATGFSVSTVLNPSTNAPDEYRVYATEGFQQIKWTTTGGGRRDMYIETTLWPTSPTFGGFSDGTGVGRDDCAHSKDPRLWDPRCGDSLGYMWKKTTCPPTGNVACENNNYWNAWPGTYNITSDMTFGIWPKSNDFGTTGYWPIINGNIINSVPLRSDTPASACEPAGTRQTVDQIWVDDALPYAAVTTPTSSVPSPGGGVIENWQWISSPAPPMNGSSSVHLSPLNSGIHQHYFHSTNEQLPIKQGDVLIAYIYITTGLAPNEIMLQWFDGTNWEHRAYWGANNIPWGTDNTSSRQRIGNIPTQRDTWVRLEVPASSVGLEGKSISGMSFVLHGGRAFWEYAGKYVPNKTSATCPPKADNGCSVYNPYDFATGAANSKAVQVRYSNGSTKWFMAFNKMIHIIDRTTRGMTPTDTWQVLWATSPDGGNWTVQPQVLFRTSGEATNICGNGGLLITDMVIDNGYFYLLFTDLLKPWSYMVRSPISTDPNSATGYGNWEVAAEPLTSTGDYTWKPLVLGRRFDFDSMGAYKVMKTLTNFVSGSVKQASIARAFASAAPNSRSRYIGITIDFDPNNAYKFTRVELWSTDSLTKPFQYESDVAIPGGIPAVEQNGWEASFLHYPDNSPSSPRILATGFELWFTEPAKGLIRHKATLSNF